MKRQLIINSSSARTDKGPPPSSSRRATGRRGSASGLPRHTIIVLVTSLLVLTSCGSLPEWMGGNPPEIKRAPGERTNVVLSPESLKPDETAKDVTVEVPEQTNLDQWLSLNQAMLTQHVGLTGVTHEQSATVGSGMEFTRNVVSGPVVADGTVFAMDAAGTVSAHDEHDISTVKWTSEASHKQSSTDVLGGGIAYTDKVLYVTTGNGNLRALDAVTGQKKWGIQVGAPVRGAPAVSKGIVVVLTADNQTLAFDATNGAPKWEQRGIRESAGYFSTISPVIGEDVVVSAYSSGEVFAIRLETGSVLWSDTLSNGSRTLASAVFNSIDADPIVQDGVVVVTSSSGEMQASALINGRPLWQQHIGAHSTPWSAGNVLYVLSDTHDIAALLKRDGAVRWATSMAVKDKRDPNRDTTPPLYGPILSGNAVLIVDGAGNVTSFKPTTGEKISSYELASGIVTSPVVANGALYVITKDAKLHRYY